MPRKINLDMSNARISTSIYQDTRKDVVVLEWNRKKEYELGSLVRYFGDLYLLCYPATRINYIDKEEVHTYINVCEECTIKPKNKYYGCLSCDGTRKNTCNLGGCSTNEKKRILVTEKIAVSYFESPDKDNSWVKLYTTANKEPEVAVAKDVFDEEFEFGVEIDND